MERCGVEVALDTYCYCDEMCIDCCDDVMDTSRRYPHPCMQLDDYYNYAHAESESVAGFLLSTPLFISTIVLIILMAIFIFILVFILSLLLVPKYRMYLKRKKEESEVKINNKTRI